jgi:hypothetical protein
LLQGLIAFYPLNETSGVRRDLVGGHNLTDSNSDVGSAAGWIYQVSGDFAGSTATNRLLDSDVFLPAYDNEWTMGLWIRLHSYPTTGTPGDPGFYRVAMSDLNAYGGRDLLINYAQQHVLRYQQSSGNQYSLHSFVHHDAGWLDVWHLIMGWFDPATDTLYMSMDNQAPESETDASPSWGTNPPAQLSVGNDNAGNGYSYSWDGQLGPLAFWNRILSAAERAEFYGGGRGWKLAGVRQLKPQARALQANMVAYWPGDEASGNLLDAHTGNYDGTDAASVTSGTGLVYASARQYTAANSEFHYIGDNAALSTGDIDFTIAFWINVDSLGANRYCVSKVGYANGQGEFLVGVADTNVLFFRVYDGTWATAVGYVAAATQGAISTGNWYFVVAWHDSVANTVNIQVNAGTVDSAATTGAVGDSTASLFIGAVGSNETGGGNFTDGRIGPTMFWKSAGGGGGVLSAAQRTALYNAGAGLTYESM